MKFDVHELQAKLDYYFTGKLSKRELGEWANKAYYDILKGGYIEIEKVTIYPLLKILSTFHLEADKRNDIYPCTEEKVKKIQEIVNGKIDIDFDIEMSVPVQVYNMFKGKLYYDKERREIFIKLRSIIASVLEQEGIINEEMVKQLEIIRRMDYQNQTVQGILEKYIFSMGRILLENSKERYKLYAKKSDENAIMKKMLDYLDSYIENNNFHLIVSFKKGVPDIFIIV